MLQLPTDALATQQGCYLDETEPKKLRAFIEQFCIYQGQPVKVLAWQWENYWLPLLGWRRPDGRLRFKRFFAWVPKKQGKSLMLACLCLFVALTRKRAKIVILSGTKKQIKDTIFEPLSEMIDSHPELAQAFWVRDHKETIECLKTGSTIQVLSGKTTQVSGPNYALIVLDEVAEMPKAYVRKIWDRLQSSGAARPNALLLTISTAQFDKTTVGYEIYRTSKEILTGRNDDVTTGSLIYEVPEHDDWRNPETWWKALPSVPDIVPKQHYFDRFNQCRDNPIESVSFRTLDLNQWCGSPECWLPPSLWNSCQEKYEEASLHKHDAVIGIDYARSYDLCAYVVLVKREGLWYVLPRFLIPEKQAAEREQRDSVPYTRWHNLPNSNLFYTSGDTVDGEFLVERIKQEAQQFNILEVRYDPTGMEMIRQALEREGLLCVAVPQSANYMAAGFRNLEQLVREGKLRHPDNPILNWNLDNCVPKIDKRDRLMVEKASDRQRIDGIDAIAIGLTHYLEQPADECPGFIFT